MKKILIIIFILFFTKINIHGLNKVLTPTEKQEYISIQIQLKNHIIAVGKNKLTNDYILQYLRDMGTPIALRLLENTIKIHKLFDEGNNLLTNKNYNEAIQKFDEAICIDEYSWFVFEKRAQAYFALNNFVEAINDYSKAINTSDNKGYLYRARAACYQALGNEIEASYDIRMANLLR